MKIGKRIAALLAVSMVTGLVHSGPVFAAYDPSAGDMFILQESGDIGPAEPSRDIVITQEASDITEVELSEDAGPDVALIADEAADDILYSEEDEGSGVTPYPGSDEACEKLNTALGEGEMMAVLYLCDEYPLKNSPSVSAENIAMLPSGTTLYLKSLTYEGGTYWFYAGAYLTETEVTGYIPKDKLICLNEAYLEWEQTISTAYDNGGGIGRDGTGEAGIPGKARESVYRFPDSYRDSLLKILSSHPNWVFVPQTVDLSLEEAVNAQYADKNRNWVYYTVKDAYKGGKINNTWYYASKTGLNYYMNPANFVGSEQNIFMFEQLTYNASYQTESGVRSVLNGTFMSGDIPGEGKTYSEAFAEIGSKLKVSPYHLAARVYQEQGKGTSPLISGTYPGYEGYYNYFNIQATGSGTSDIYRNGLSYAKGQGWNTRYKSLEGGAKFDSKNYILAGQDTPYLEKYNVVKKTYWHQYMQNASAPLTEAQKVYSMYKNSGALNNPFVFKIPVYKGDKISPAPPIKPAYKIKNSQKSNLYYTMDTDEAAALYTIEASEEIIQICLDPAVEETLAAGTKPYYTVDSYDDMTGLLKLKPALLTNKNYTKIQKKVTLNITFKDYGQITCKLTVPVINKAPSIKVSGATLYNGAFNGRLALAHAGLPGDTTVSVNHALLTAALNDDRTAVDVEAAGPFKSGSRKLTFMSDAWRAPVTRSVTIKYIGNPAAAYTFSTGGKIRLSRPDDSYIKYTPKMSSFPSLTVEDVILEGDNAGLFTAELIKKGELLPNGKTVTGSGGVIIVRAADEAELIAGSKYTLAIRSILSNGLEIVKTVTVKPAK